MQTEQVDYGFKVGDQVIHIKGGDSGYVTELDVENDLGGVTTARVVWEHLLSRTRKLLRERTRISSGRTN